MPSKRDVYKVSAKEIERQFALSVITDQKEESAAISLFCDMFSIPLNDANIKTQTHELQVLKTLLSKTKK